MDVGPLLGGGVFALLGVVAVGVGASSLRQWYRLTRLDTVSIHDAALDPGPVEIGGDVHADDDDLLEAPLSRRPCVAYEYRIQRRSSDSWTTVDHGDDRTPFAVADGTGTAYVDPGDASLSLERDRIADVDPHSLPATVDAQPSLSGRRRYVEHRLEVGSVALVHGDGEPATSRDADVQITGGDEAGLFLVGDGAESAVGRRLLNKGAAVTPLGGLFVGVGSLLALGGL